MIFQSWYANLSTLCIIIIHLSPTNYASSKLSGNASNGETSYGNVNTKHVPLPWQSGSNGQTHYPDEQPASEQYPIPDISLLQCLLFPLLGHVQLCHVGPEVRRPLSHLSDSSPGLSCVHDAARSSQTVLGIRGQSTRTGHFCFLF